MEYILHKLPEGFIVTSDESIEKGWKGLAYKKDVKGFVFNHFYTENTWYNDAKKVIAQQDQIDFSALSEEEQKKIGWFDKIINDNFKGLHDAIGDRDISDFYIELIKTYTQELLSDRKFTLDDMLEIAGYMAAAEKYQSIESLKEIALDYIQSLSKQSWEVELEMEDKIALDGHTVIGKEPKLTNGKIKILKLT